MKSLFGMARRQTTGFAENLLQLSGLDWSARDFRMLSRCLKTLNVNIPHQGSEGLLHLLIESAGINVEAKASGMLASMAAPNAASGAMFTLGSM